MSSPATFLTSDQRNQLVNAIREAEGKSLGEIRIYFEKHCRKNILDRAVEVFYHLKMEKTKLRTGILIYVAYSDHVFAILGDRGIHEKVPANFWDETKELMGQYFKDENYMQGLLKGIHLAGEQLRKYFASTGTDTNEITDDIVVKDE